MGDRKKRIERFGYDRSAFGGVGFRTIHSATPQRKPDGGILPDDRSGLGG